MQQSPVEVKTEELSAKLEALAKEIVLLKLGHRGGSQEATTDQADPAAVFVDNEIAGIDGKGRLTKLYSDSIHFTIVGCPASSFFHLKPGDIKLLIAPKPGDYIVAIGAIDGSNGIACVPVAKTIMNFPDFANAVGRVVAMTDKSIVVKLL